MSAVFPTSLLEIPNLCDYPKEGSGFETFIIDPNPVTSKINRTINRNWNSNTYCRNEVLEKK